MNLKDHPLFKQRAKRKEQKEKSEEKKYQRDLLATLSSDLMTALSEKGITIRNAVDVAKSLKDKGWTKKEFLKRSWN